MAVTKTKLSKDEIDRISKFVLSYLMAHTSINNRTLRAITGIGYDQAIHFFGEMLKEGRIQKVGEKAGTKYILAKDVKKGTLLNGKTEKER
jgi:hypothetical protein